MTSIPEIRAALDAKFGGNFVAEVARLEGEIQRAYDATLGHPEKIQLRFSLARMLDKFRDLKQLLVQKDELLACVERTSAHENPPHAIPS